MNRSPMGKAPPNPWRWPSKPWQRINIDYAGPFMTKMFLLVVDAHSKWLEVITMSSTTSESTINALRYLFSSFGLVEEIVSDNGPQFVLNEFQDCLRQMELNTFVLRLIILAQTVRQRELCVRLKQL